MIEQNLEKIRGDLVKNAKLVGRDPSSVELVAVSKTVPIEAIQEAYECGQRHFGESRLQEALPKISALPDDIVWHFIGTLQGNKAKKIAEHFSWIHSLANLDHLREIGKANAKPSLLIEVNIAKEEKKSGILPEALDGFSKSVLQWNHVQLRGLMMIGPPLDDAEEQRGNFKACRLLAEEILENPVLSMGMSGDYEVAVQEGSHFVRVGSAIFGQRV
jgi:pyridoxal phosphate enzyme (YggS family)